MLRLTLTLLIATCTLAACGDDDSSPGGGGDCGSFSACGGDLVGDWEVQDVCFENPEALFTGAVDEPACDDAFRGLDVDASGSYSFGDDGNGSSSVTLSMTIDTRWTEACISAIANGAEVDINEACDALQTEYMGQAEFEAADCSVSGTACNCLLTAAERTVTGMGTYRVQGNALVDADGNNPFCVEGDTLTLSISAEGLTGHVVLTRSP